MSEASDGRTVPAHSVWENVRFVVSAIKEFDKRLLPYVGLNVAASAMGQFVPVVMPKAIIDELTGSRDAGTVIAYSVAFGVLLLVSNGVSSATQMAIFNRFICVRLALIARAGRKFMRMDYQHLEDPKVLDLSQKGDRACNDNQNGIEGVMHRTQAVSTKALTLLGTGTIITMLNPLLLLAILCLLALNYAMSDWTRKRDKAENDKLAPVWRRLWYLGTTMSDFKFAKDIRMFSMQGFLERRYRSELDNRYSGQSRIWGLWARNSYVVSTTGLLQEGLLYAWLCRSVLYGGMGIGDFTMYAAAIRTFSGALGGLLDDISHIRRQNEIINDYRGFLDYPDTADGDEPVPMEALKAGVGFGFENVSFRYPGSDEYVIKDLSFEIRPGERLAIVGLNGAGKTTFVKLLTRLYEPESGRILMNGRDIRSYGRREYYRLFSTVFQEIEMFAFTVAENVSMTEYARTRMERVAETLEKAGLSGKIEALPKGVDQTVLKVVEDDGVEFSGGESQKLALARALYKDAPVIVLDEPTAALDALAEERLYMGFAEMTKGKTAVYISHRLASTRFCDRVAMFEGGRITECGTHDELVAKGGRYAELFALQAKYYNDDGEVAV